MNKKINTEELDQKFDNLLKSDNICINSIEDLMINEIEDYKKELKLHIEELLVNKIKEKEIVNKKNKNCKSKE